MSNIHSKFEEIAEDLTYNVTNIYGRYDMIYLADLIFHSVLSFDFRGERIHKGWAEGLLLGDTRVGKSRTMKSLVRHYRAGEFITGEDLSKAGLLGGVQMINSRWNITWGKIPLLNRRIAVIDEVNNLSQELIAGMSGMRSSGIAEITKIQTNKTEARTRQLWIGNPRGSMFLNQYSHGIVAIKELIGNLDDIARFDIALTCAAEEVDDYTFNKPDRRTVEHVYTSDRCHNLIMWAWSRRPEQIIFIDDADIAILEFAKVLGNEYTSIIPLMNPSEARIKLAKLSIAAACRTFSTDDTYENVLVTPDHVGFVVDIMREFYNKPSMGYDVFTKIQEEERHLEDENKIRNYILNKGMSFLNGLLQYNYIGYTDIMDISGQDRDGAKDIVSFLVTHRCLKKMRTSYVKSPAFNKLLRQMKVDSYKGRLDIPKRKLIEEEDRF